MKRSELYTLIENKVNQILFENTNISDIKSIEWNFPVYGSRGNNNKLYKLIIKDKHNKEISVRNLIEFNKLFDTNIDHYSGFDKFSKEIKKINPHITLTDTEFDVS